MDHLAHCACVDSTEQHSNREAACAFADGVKGDLRQQLLLRGKRTLSEALNQALEVEAGDVVVGTPSTFRQANAGTLWTGRRPPQTTPKDHRLPASCTCREPYHFRGNCHYGKEAENDDRSGKRDERIPSDTWESPGTSSLEWRPRNDREAHSWDGRPSGSERVLAENGGLRPTH
jgi:hypothetical protein